MARKKNGKKYGRKVAIWNPQNYKQYKKNKTNITYLDLTGKNLNDAQFYNIIKKYPNLQVLICSNNQITNVDHLPASLQRLYCDGNQITSVDHLPCSLQTLYCGYNKITNLDHLPPGLQNLICWGNKITNLDYLPASLQKLDCSNNQITDLDYLPASLLKLDCGYDKITSLDYLPCCLQKIKCLQNPFKISMGIDYGNGYLSWRDEVLIDHNNNKAHIKRSNYLRFLRNLINIRKTYLLLSLQRIQQESYYGSQCLPNDIIKHIISFV